MIRSSKTTIKFSNRNKINSINEFIDEYHKLIQFFVDKIWEMDKIPSLLPKEITDQAKQETWLSARMIQCAAKQASGIVRGTRQKQRQRKHVIDELNKQGKFKQARKLKEKYDNVKMSKPEIKNCQPELDSRFISIDLDNNTSFDGWITIGTIGNKKKTIIPFKRTKHFNKLYEKGQLKKGIRLSKSSITFMFEIEGIELVEKSKSNKKYKDDDVYIKEEGKTLGIDIGQNKVITCSNGFSSEKCNHGHNLGSINRKMSRKKKGSKAFGKCQEHRKNYINWSINQLDLKSVKKVKREKIKNIRYKSRTNRMLTHWTYTEIFDKLDRYCQDNNVCVEMMSPTYTSQRCSQCGWTRKINRKGEQFRCSKCSFECDADLNASTNIGLSLSPIEDRQRKKKINREGFYWLPQGQEPIVPDGSKTNYLIIQ